MSNDADRGEIVQVGLADAVPEDRAVPEYVEATLTRPGPYELHETPVGRMADLVAQVVQVEFPVHVDEVVTRVRDAFGLQRAGARIQAAVEQGVERAVTQRGIVREGDFLSLADATVIVRDRRNASSSGLRKVEMLPPSEIEIGVFAIVAENLGATDDEVIRLLSRMVGLRASNSQLKAAIVAVIADLVERSLLERKDGMLVTGTVAVPVLGKRDDRLEGADGTVTTETGSGDGSGKEDVSNAEGDRNGVASHVSAEA